MQGRKPNPVPPSNVVPGPFPEAATILSEPDWAMSFNLSVAVVVGFAGGRIGILSQEAGQRRVTAVLDARDPAGGLDMLASGLGLRVVRPFAWLTLLLPA